MNKTAIFKVVPLFAWDTETCSAQACELPDAKDCLQWRCAL